jgi:hypothetical protein
MDSYERLKAEIPEIAKAVNEFKSEQVQQQAFRALLGALGLGLVNESGDDEADQGDVGEARAGAAAAPRRRGRRKAAAPAKDPGTNDAARRASRAKKGAAPSFDTSLNLRPKGGQSFEEFADSKKPTNFDERNLVSVYYLTRVAKTGPATVDQIYTCYKDRSWRLPADPRNSLAMTAFKRGWLNTKNMDDIKLSMPGENYVEHDLPAKAKA